MSKQKAPIEAFSRLTKLHNNDADIDSANDGSAATEDLAYPLPKKRGRPPKNRTNVKPADKLTKLKVAFLYKATVKV